jgi:hypothetical protein
MHSHDACTLSSCCKLWDIQNIQDIQAMGHSKFGICMEGTLKIPYF